MKTFKELYEEKKRKALPIMINTFSKPRYRQPMDKEGQATLNKFMKQIYNPRLKKLEENERFREEWIEPEIIEITD